MYRRCLLLLAAAGLLMGGCEDASAPDGGESTISVRAFVDANGSGAFDSGDVPLSGLPVTLTAAAGSNTYSASTDAQGVAQFTGVRPGSYQAGLGGSAPAGALLSSAAAPVIVAPFEGGEVSGEFRFAYLPGSISGVLFRDNNNNNQFDAGVDTPAPGLPVTLLGATGTTALASTTTSSAGAFSFAGLRPGAYRVIVSALPTMTIVGGDTIQVTVGPQAPLPVAVKFTGNLISPLSAVRTEPAGAVVAFEGVATVGVGIFSTSTTGNQFNVQDASGAGILILQVPLSSGIVAGDSVRVIGTTAISSGEFLITSNPTITKLGTGTIPAPRVITAAQVVASTATDPLQGSLVKVNSVVVDSVQGGTAAGYNVYVRDGSGNKFIVRVGTAAVGVLRSSWTVGGTYDVTGTLGNFNGPQIKIRSAADVRSGTTALPIAVARTRTANDTVTVVGVVTAAPGPLGSTTMYIQDASGGIMVFNTPSPTTVALGDSVQLTARVSAFGGEPQLDRFSSTSPIQLVKLGTGTVPAPLVIGGATLTARTAEGRLVKAPSLRVDSVQTTTSTSSYNVFAKTTDGVAVQIRMASSGLVTAIPKTSWVVGNSYDVVGVLGTFNGAPQIKVRSAADITAGTSLLSIAQAKALANTTPVIVEGVVTVAPGNFRSQGDNMYIQDASGGIAVFNGTTSLGTLKLGDVVRLEGIMGTNSTEKQIVRPNTATPITVTVIGSAPVPTPRVVTDAEFTARTYEGSLVTITNFEVVTIGTVSGTTGSYNVTGKLADGSAALVRVQSTAVGIASTSWVVGGKYDVTGVLGSFNSAPQIFPRSSADVVRR